MCLFKIGEQKIFGVFVNVCVTTQFQKDFKGPIV